MKVIINYQEFELVPSCDLVNALATYGVKEKIFAVAVNGKVIARTEYATLKLKEADQVDILIPMQGG